MKKFKYLFTWIQIFIHFSNFTCIAMFLLLLRYKLGDESMPRNNQHLIALIWYFNMPARKLLTSTRIKSNDRSSFGNLHREVKLWSILEKKFGFICALFGILATTILICIPINLNPFLAHIFLQNPLHFFLFIIFDWMFSKIWSKLNFFPAFEHISEGIIFTFKKRIYHNATVLMDVTT